MFGDLTEDYSLGVNLLDRSEELLQRGRGGSQGWGVGSGEGEDMLKKKNQKTTNHKNQLSQINNFSAFLCMGRSKSPGSLKLFL